MRRSKRRGVTKRMAVAASALAVAAIVSLLPASAASTGAAYVFAGNKDLEKGDWEPVDSQPCYGIQGSLGQADWPVLVAVDFMMASDDSPISTPSVGTGQASGSSIEVFTGVRKFWGDRIRPFLGAGVMFIQSEIELNTNLISQSEDDTSVGGWVDTGVLWRIHPRFHLGVDAKFSSATAYFGTNLGGRDRIEAGGIYLGVLVGTGW